MLLSGGKKAGCRRIYPQPARRGEGFHPGPWGSDVITASVRSAAYRSGSARLGASGNPPARTIIPIIRGWRRIRISFRWRSAQDPPSDQRTQAQSIGDLRRLMEKTEKQPRTLCEPRHGGTLPGSGRGTDHGRQADSMNNAGAHYARQSSAGVDSLIPLRRKHAPARKPTASTRSAASG